MSFIVYLVDDIINFDQAINTRIAYYKHDLNKFEYITNHSRSKYSAAISSISTLNMSKFSFIKKYYCDVIKLPHIHSFSCEQYNCTKSFMHEFQFTKNMNSIVTKIPNNIDVIYSSDDSNIPRYRNTQLLYQPNREFYTSTSVRHAPRVYNINYNITIPEVICIQKLYELYPEYSFAVIKNTKRFPKKIRLSNMSCIRNMLDNRGFIEDIIDIIMDFYI